MKEKWKDIEGYEGKYMVSNCGLVKSMQRKVTYNTKCNRRGKFNSQHTICERIMSQFKDSRGCCAVSLYKNRQRKRFYVHRLVAQAFIPNPNNKPHINHKDCKPENNCVDNLEWVTPKENAQHASRNGLLVTTEYQKSQTSKANKGSGHGYSKLHEDDIPVIRRMRSEGMTYKNIASKFNVNRATIGYILRGKTWTHV